MNRKGGAPGKGILFFIFFFMGIMIAGGLVGGVSAFYGKGYDFRGVDAFNLYDVVSECFDKPDFFIEEFTENTEKFYELCRLSKDVLEKGHLVYIKEVLKTNDGKEFFVGVYDFKTQCFLEARGKNKNLPVCKSGVLNKDGREFEIIIGSNQNSRKGIL
ncbi:MAG: hypothetical protein Q8P57_02255 [Candidatus Pacearchaeota archaeon]|nr:hypothetical protein [Candidatus Pacearchaeota archaeon]